MRQLRMCLLGLLLLVAAPAVLCQQLGTGTITGTVVDSNGAAIVGATVKVTNTATGVVRTVATNSAGQFNAPVLPAGKYTVTIEQTGFSKLEQQNLEVNVGASVSLNLEMKAGGATETINITAQPELDTTKTEESSLINRTQINDLPINGRRFDQFALLAPGVTRDGRFGLLSYHGQSGVFNNFTIEGNDDNQAFNSEARGRTRIASSISANAIQEFQVEQSSFLPEFGRSAGGGVNSTIRSGGNQVHGDGFYYFRNKWLNAQDPTPGSIKPSELRQQFGGSLSGPIKSDKAFFFVNYDQQLRNAPIVINDSGLFRPGTLTGTNLTDFNAGCADVINRIKAIPGVTVNPGLNCAGTATQNVGTIARKFNQNLFLAKTDVNIDSRNTLSVSYNYLNARSPEGIQTGLVLGNVGGNGFDGVRLDVVNVRLTSTLDSTKVNEMRFQFGRDFEFETADQPGPNVIINPSGFSFGQATFLQRPANPNERRLQYVDNFSYIRGKHTLKFGGEVNRAKDVINNPAFFAGGYTYPTLNAYGHDLVTAGARSYTTYRQNLGLPGVSFSTTDYAGFAQDQFKATRKLTVNYGVRYDYEQFPRAQFGNPAFPLTTTFPADKTNWGPRIGVAWDPTGSGKTVIRGGYGLYYGRSPNGMISNALLQTGSADPNRATIVLSQNSGQGPVYPNILATTPANLAGGSPFFLDPDFKRPRLQEANGGVQRELPWGMTINASFVYTKGDRLPLNFDANLPAATASNIFIRTFSLPDGSTFTTNFLGVANNGSNAARPIPTLGAITQVKSVGESWYKGLLVDLRKRFSNNFQFGIAYTLASAQNLYGTDTGGGTGAEGPFGGSIVLDQFAPLDKFKGRAPTDQRHRFVANGIYNFKANSSSEAVNWLVNGFRLSGIFTAESGRPFPTTITTGNLSFGLNGQIINGFGGLFGQGSAGTLLPTVDRNNNTGEANYRVDMRLARDIKISERFNLEMIVESFNLFNHSNFNGFTSGFAANPAAPPANTPAFASSSTVIPLSAVTTPLGTPNNDASPPDGTNARRFQLALRFRF